MFRRCLLVVVLVASVACEPDGDGPGRVLRTPLSSPTSSDSRVIALVGTISGPDAWRGTDALEGADVAVGRLNRGLGPGERRYELLTLDDGGDADAATDLVRQIAQSDRTVGVVYAGPPEGLPPAEDALAEAKIPAFAIYGDLYGARLLTPHVFQVAPSYTWEARRIAAYLLEDRRYERVGALVEESVDGSAAQTALRGAFRLTGAPTPVIAEYPSSGEVAPLLVALRDQRVEAVVLHGSPAVVAEALQALRDAGATYTSTAAARTVSAAPAVKRRRGFGARPWRPQVVAFDGAISPSVDPPPPVGTVAADGYARGAHYLPIPSFEAFRDAFVDWGDQPPLGWERRAYEAVRALGWAVARTGNGEDIAHRLERIRGVRFGGVDVTLGPDDHTFAAATTIGLWVVPRPGAAPEGTGLPEALPWVLLSRGFSIDGETTDILEKDWEHMFTRSPPAGGPAPRYRRMRYGVTTTPRDPVH